MTSPEMDADEAMAEDMRGRLERGEFGPPGTKLPTQAQLAEEYEVSVATVHFALRPLRRAGLVRGVQGGRMYVADPNTDTGADVETTEDI